MLEDKVAFLRDPDNYPDQTVSVIAVETHRSWVFLTDLFAYKLKKPGFYSYVDASTVAARRYLCEEELRLNRRLAGDVYIATVPLALDDGTRLKLEAGGVIIDWLVKMQRLPENRMLDAYIRRNEIPEEGICRLAQKLARFYQQSQGLGATAVEYRSGLEAGVRANEGALIRPAFGLPEGVIRDVCVIQLGFLARESRLFDRRTGEGRVIEAHGDLRPEHVCLLEPDPVIIDCLEFSLQLRTLDAVAELAFLEQECDRLGAPQVGDIIFEIYRQITRDRPPAPLVNFYKSYWACVRARLCALHLSDANCRDPDKWSQLAAEYLQRAQSYASSI